MKDRTRTPYGLALAVAAAAALLAAGCGTDETEPLTKEAFIEQADAICEETQDEVEPYWTQFRTDFEEDIANGSAEEAWFPLFEELLDDVVPIDRRQIEQLRALEPPSTDGEVVDSMLDDYEAALDVLQESAADAAAGDEAARARTSSGAAEDPLDAVARRAQAYGLTVCGAAE